MYHTLTLLKIKNPRLKVPPQSPLTLRKATLSRPIVAPIKLRYYLFIVLISIFSLDTKILGILIHLYT